MPGHNVLNAVAHDGENLAAAGRRIAVHDDVDELRVPVVYLSAGKPGSRRPAA